MVWGFVYACVDPNVIWAKMFVMIINLLNKMCRIQTIRVSRDRPLYITDELIEVGHHRDELFKIAKNSNEPEDWSEAKSYRQKTNYEIKKAKKYCYPLAFCKPFDE